MFLMNEDHTAIFNTEHILNFGITESVAENYIVSALTDAGVAVLYSKHNSEEEAMEELEKLAGYLNSEV